MRNDLLHLLDEIAARGDSAVTAAAVRGRLDLSPQATSNVLARAVRDGFLDKVSSGTYALRPIGMLGTRAASEDIALAVAARFSGRPHRIAYRSALDYHGLLVHPSRVIQVVLARRAQVALLSGRRLQVFVEPEATLGVGREPTGHGAFVSTVERALLESANRPRHVGGWTTIAHALSSGSWDPILLQQLSQQLDMAVALRRIGSIVEHAGPVSRAGVLAKPPAGLREIPLDPYQPVEDPWLDPDWRVRWPTQPDDARESMRA